MIEPRGEGGGGAAPGDTGFRVKPGMTIGKPGTTGCDLADDEMRDGEERLGLRGAGEEELVVLAAGDGEGEGIPAEALAAVLQREGERDRRDVNFGIHPRCIKNMLQIRTEAVGEVHHGVHAQVEAKLLALRHARNRAVVPVDQALHLHIALHPFQDGLQAGGGIAQRTGHADDIALLGVAAQPGACVRAFAENGHIDADPVRRGGGVAAEQGRSKALRNVGIAVHESVDPIRVQVGGEGEGEESARGLAAHRGDVAEIDGGGLPAEIVRRNLLAEEMRTFNEHVAADEGVAAGGLGQHGAIVADARHPVGGAETRLDALNEAEFAEFRKLHDILFDNQPVVGRMDMRRQHGRKGLVPGQQVGQVGDVGLARAHFLEEIETLLQGGVGMVRLDLDAAEGDELHAAQLLQLRVAVQHLNISKIGNVAEAVAQHGELLL